MRTLVIYHDNCLDGIASAYLMSKRIPDAKFIPASYDKPLENALEKGDTVYIVDFSFPPEVLIEWAKTAFSITVIDHHASFERDLQSAGFHVLDKNKDVGTPYKHYKTDAAVNLGVCFYSTVAGTGAVADFLGLDLEWYPKVLKAIDERDRWVFTDPQTKPLTEVAKLFKKDVATFAQFVEKTGLDTMLEMGQVLLRKMADDCDSLLSGAHTANVCGNTVVAVNASYLHASEICDKMMQVPSTEGYFEAAVSYRYDRTGRVTLSLRSTPTGPDVGAIAKLLGGGGHKNAAGCIVSKEVFEQMVKDSAPVNWYRVTEGVQ